MDMNAQAILAIVQALGLLFFGWLIKRWLNEPREIWKEMGVMVKEISDKLSDHAVRLAVVEKTVERMDDERRR